VLSVLSCHTAMPVCQHADAVVLQCGTRPARAGEGCLHAILRCQYANMQTLWCSDVGIVWLAIVIFIYDVCTVFMEVKLPNMRSCTVKLYGSGQPLAHDYLVQLKGASYSSLVPSLCSWEQPCVLGTMCSWEQACVHEPCVSIQ